MPILKSNPDRIIIGNSLQIMLEVDDKITKNNLNGKYINLNIRKVGTTKSITINPQRYNNNSSPLEWDINPSIYETHGTFIVEATITGSVVRNSIYSTGYIVCSTTFIIEEIYSPPNLTHINNKLKIKNYDVVIPDDTIQAFQNGTVEKKGQIIPLSDREIKQMVKDEKCGFISVGGQVQKKTLTINPQ